MDLSNDELLKKCLHGKTQNNNESTNNVIWKRCSKDIYVGRNVLELGTFTAVINFNDGYQGMLKVFKELGINHGEYCINFCENKIIIEFNKRKEKQQLQRNSDENKCQLSGSVLQMLTRNEKVCHMGQVCFEIY